MHNYHSYLVVFLDQLLLCAFFSEKMVEWFSSASKTAFRVIDSQTIIFDFWSLIILMAVLEYQNIPVIQDGRMFVVILKYYWYDKWR